MAPPLGPNGQKFFNDALPGNAGDHVLMVGEDHNLTDHYTFLLKQMPDLIRNHNLAAVGLELAPYTNVLLWAYKDGKLPVPKEQSAEYIQSLFSAQWSSYDSLAPVREAMVKTALDNNVAVAAIDARHLLSDPIAPYKTVEQNHQAEKIVQTVLERNPQIVKELRTNARDAAAHMAEKVRQYLPAGKDLYSNPLNDPRFIEEESLRIWQKIEIRNLLEKNPEYQKRLGAVENAIIIGREEKIPSDTMTARLFAQSIPPGKNGMVIYGEDHLSGMKDKDRDENGQIVINPFKSLLAASMENIDNGKFHVTSTLLTSEQYERYRVNGVLYDRRYFEECYIASNIVAYNFDTDTVGYPRPLALVPAAEKPPSLKDILKSWLDPEKSFRSESSRIKQLADIIEALDKKDTEALALEASCSTFGLPDAKGTITPKDLVGDESQFNDAVQKLKNIFNSPPASATPAILHVNIPKSQIKR